MVYSSTEAESWVDENWKTTDSVCTGGRVKRPLNKFFLFRTWWIHSQMHLPEYNTKEMRALVPSKRASKIWHSLSVEQQAKWTLRAAAWNTKHISMFPSYKFRPRRNEPLRRSSQKTRRRSTSSATPSPSPPPCVPPPAITLQTMACDGASFPGPSQLFEPPPMPEGWTAPTPVVPSAHLWQVPQMTPFVSLGAAEQYPDFNAGASSLSSPMGSISSFDSDFVPSQTVFNDDWFYPDESVQAPMWQVDPAFSASYPPSYPPSNSLFSSDFDMMNMPLPLPLPLPLSYPSVPSNASASLDGTDGILF